MNNSNDIKGTEEIMGLFDVLDRLTPADSDYYEAARKRLDMLAKPPGSLGELEEIAARICAISRNLRPNIETRCVIVASADNGVVEEGVSIAPKDVTRLQTLTILEGFAGVSAIARQFKTEVMVADLGIDAKVYQLLHPWLIEDFKLRKSTSNIVKGAAMTANEAMRAIMSGVELVERAVKKGHKAIGAGEMGIGNTTTAAAVLAALLDLNGYEEISRVTGRGAGLDDSSYGKKIEIIAAALEKNLPNSKDRKNPINVLEKVGGFDICAMAGMFIGAAYFRIPAVIDGFVSSVAALCAVKINPMVKDYIFASHLSHERGASAAMEALGLSPVLMLNMRLGEGSGCPLMFALMDAALTAYRDMATFKDADLDVGYDDSDNIKF